VLGRAGWKYSQDSSDGSILLLCCSGDNILRITMITRDRTDLIVEWISIDRRTPEQYREAMGDFCNQINDSLAIAFWSVDENDGEVRCRHAVEVTGIGMTPTFIDNFAKAVLGQAKRCHNAIQAVMNGVPVCKALEMTRS
jgi:hypothetical protein